MTKTSARMHIRFTCKSERNKHITYKIGSLCLTKHHTMMMYLLHNYALHREDIVKEWRYSSMHS
jgi:hypothetical protein